MLELLEDATMEAIRIRAKWENDDYICRGHILNGMFDYLFDVYTNVESAKELWDSLESKYMVEDSSSKKFRVSNFNNYKMVDSRPVMKQYNEIVRILGQYTQHELKMNEFISVSSIIDKLPPSWKDFKHILKHGKDDLSLVQLGSHLRIEESLRAQDSKKRSNENNSGYGSNKKPKLECWKCGKTGHFKRDFRSDSGATTHVCKDHCWFKTFEPVEEGSVLYMGVIHETIAPYTPQQNDVAERKNRALKEMVNSMLSYSGLKSRDAIFDENRFYSIPRPNDIIPNSDESQRDDHSDDVPCKISEPRKEPNTPAVYGSQGGVGGEGSGGVGTATAVCGGDGGSGGAWCRQRGGGVDGGSVVMVWMVVVAVGCDVEVVTAAVKVAREESGVGDRIDRETGSLFGFFGKSPPEKFSGGGGVVAVVAGRRWGAAIHNLVIHQMDVKTTFLNGDLDEEVNMKQPEGFVMPGYSDASWINHVEDSSSTSGWAFLLGGGTISWASKKQTCITGSTMESEFVAFAAAGKEAEWLRNLIHEIPI
nr:zinc finger, CCHC-type [Tanacetum cinerariifolium]